MTPEQIAIIRKVLDDLAREGTGNGECSCRGCVLEGAAAEYLRLHDACGRLCRITSRDVQREADSLGVCPAMLAYEVERIVRRFLR